MTTIEETLTKLDELRLCAMADATRELMRSPPDQQLNFEEKLGLVVDREWTARDNRRTARRLKEAKLATRAALDDVTCSAERGIAKATVRQLATCRWVREHHNVIVVGKTGVGKSYLGAALADAACRAGHRALFVRVLQRRLRRDPFSGRCVIHTSDRAAAISRRDRDPPGLDRLDHIIG